MADILSQNEIDELLKAFDSGVESSIVVEQKESKKAIRDYNFSRPSKFNKEQLRTLGLVFDNYARIVSSFLTGYLRTSTQIEFVNAEQMLYNEFNNSLNNPVILGLINLKPLKGTVILELSSNVGYAILDRILGGSGVSIKRIREFSEIEKILLERIISQMINFLIEPWENLIKLKPTLEKLETNSQFAQIISPNEITALVTLSVKIGKAEGFINFCLPHMVIESIMQRLNTKHWFKKQEQEDTQGNRDELESQLQDTKIPIATVIGKTTVTINDFINLQKGDIITLDSYMDSDLSIMVGNILKFHGRPGINRGKNAIQITGLVKKGE
jgi:flagellar motor switch protein FliM